MKLKDRASDYEKLFTQSEIEGQPSLKLDLSLSKPIIIMPRGTHSTESVKNFSLRYSCFNFMFGFNKLSPCREMREAVTSYNNLCMVKLML